MSERIDLVYDDGRTESVLIKQPTNTSVLFYVTDENGERIQMLKIAPEGFFIRDSVESVAPENEAREVYEAFKLFLALGDTVRGSADSVAPSIWLGPVKTIDNSRTWTRTSPSSSSCEEEDT